MMKTKKLAAKILSAVLVCLFGTTLAFPCSAPEPIYGWVSYESFGVSMPEYPAYVQLSTFEGDYLDTIRVNMFGFYLVEVLPCSSYSVRAFSRERVYLPQPVLVHEFKGDGVRRDLHALQIEIGQ